MGEYFGISEKTQESISFAMKIIAKDIDTTCYVNNLNTYQSKPLTVKQIKKRNKNKQAKKSRKNNRK